MKSIKVCEYSRSRSFHDDLILQNQASGERSQDQWSSGSLVIECMECMLNTLQHCNFEIYVKIYVLTLANLRTFINQFRVT